MYGFKKFAITLLSTATIASSILTMTSTVHASSASTESVTANYERVKGGYKMFTANNFVIPEYDTWYKQLAFKYSYTRLQDKVVEYRAGKYNGYEGHITTFQCQYKIF